MGSKLGAAFLRCSLGPLNYAGGCILARKVPEGLNELSADSLHGGLRRGIEEAARHAGVGVADVERLLPMADVRAAAARLDLAQKNAVAAWSTFAGHLGGLMQGVADLTVDGRAPDVSNFLERLAKKVVRDPQLSEPLQALATAVADWLDLVERCADLIGDGGVLARAYQLRRLRRIGAVVAAGLVCVGAIGTIVWIHGVRARVDAALAVADPCAVAIDPGDLARASSDQQKRAAEQQATCAAKRAAEEKARQEKERQEAEARAAAEQKRAHEQACAALAEHVEAGTLAPGDDAAAGAKAALLGRVAKKSLEAGDLLEDALPCADTSAVVKLSSAYAAAVAASTTTWSRPEAVGKLAYDALVRQKDALPGSPKQVLSQHADRTAMKAIVSKDDGAKERALTLCRLTEALGIKGGKYCATLGVLAARR